MESYQLYLDRQRAFLNLPVQTPFLPVIWFNVNSDTHFSCARKSYITVTESGQRKSESGKENQSRMKVNSTGKTDSQKVFSWQENAGIGCVKGSGNQRIEASICFNWRKDFWTYDICCYWKMNRRDRIQNLCKMNRPKGDWNTALQII